MTSPFKRPGRPTTQDDERLTRLYQDTREDLLAFLLRRCATAEDAADCLAETYRIAWEKRKRIPAEPDARPWLFGVARNTAREKHRNSQRQTAATRALALAAESSYIETTPQSSALAAAMTELSTLDREIIMMLSTDGLSSRETASILGLSPTAVRSRAHRARQKLRTRLASAEADEPPEIPEPIPTTATHAL